MNGITIRINVRPAHAEHDFTYVIQDSHRTHYKQDRLQYSFNIHAPQYQQQGSHGGQTGYGQGTEEQG